MSGFRVNYFEFWRLAQFGLKLLSRSGDGIHIVVQKFLDTKRDLNVFSTITSLPRTILLRGKLRKFCFPISEHMGLYANEVAYLADLEVKFLRYIYSSVAHKIKNVLKFCGAKPPLVYVFIALVSIGKTDE